MNVTRIKAIEERMLLEGEEFRVRLQSPEAREAFAAFLERRRPDFSRFTNSPDQGQSAARQILDSSPSILGLGLPSLGLSVPRGSHRPGEPFSTRDRCSRQSNRGTRGAQHYAQHRGLAFMY